MNNQKQVALYARVSTVKKDETGEFVQDPEVQLQALREHAQREGWTVQAEYVDRASGAKEKRPALDRLMADARMKKFDVVLVWKFDRFARSVIHLHTALKTFQALGISFASKTEAADTGTTAGRMMFTILGAFAEMERELIGERVKAGMKTAKSQGVKFGPNVCLEEISQVQFLVREQGMTIREVSRKLDIPLTTTRRRLVSQLEAA
jgi:DNA invertase Pin-like site-specific DNA recombinase